MSEMDHLEAMLTLAEATGDIVHAVNNHLNSLLLQGACLGMMINPEAKQSLESMRAEAKKAAVLLRALQVVRPWPSKPGEMADAAAAARSCTGIEVEAPDSPVMVAGSPMALKRLMTLLARLATRAVREPARPRMDVNAERVQVTLPGVKLDADESGNPALAVEAGPGLPELEQKAARWVVREMNRQLGFEAVPGGAVMRVRW